MSLLTTTYAKVAAVVAATALIATLAFSVATPAHAALTESQIQSIISLLQSFGADQTTINNVDASLRGQTPSGGTGTGSTGGTCSVTFDRNLNIGSTGADVLALQQWLNSNGFQIAASGAGSPGNETNYYGSLTAAAVGKYQAANAASILTPLGLSAANVPFPFGPATRTFLNANCGTGPGTGPGTGTPVAGSGLTVNAGSQPVNALAPQATSRVPFTRFTVTAGADGAVTMNSVTVQRTGLGSNAAFAGVVLIDQDGNQLGTAKTFNSNDQATIGEAVVVPAGQTRTFTVAGNMAASLAAYAGEAPSISVVGINTSATVTGTLPITGANHTINATLTTGTITVATSQANATNANATKEIGTTQYKTTGLRLTAGSAEDVRLKMVRLNQTGSASTVNDLANIQVVIDGTAYPTTVSADGKFVTANLGSGILIPEGDSVEMYVQFDIVGSNANGRTVIFDVDETTDIFGTGVTFGYGVSPSAGSSSVPSSRGTLTITSGTPYIYATQVTISGASVTTIDKANSVPAQNVAVNVQDQTLGGFVVDIKGEAITVQSLAVTVSTSSGSGTGVLTNVTIVDENGNTVAGPIDASTTGTTLTFSDSITFPTGQHTYTIKGKIASGIGNGTVYTLSTNPSSQWTNVKGDLTGDTVTLSQGSFNMNPVTVKTAALVISRATSPASQTVVAGGTAVHMVNFALDATDSGEDVRLSSFLTSLTETDGLAGAPNLLTSCQFFDGTTALNTGSNVLNPDGTATTSADTDTVTFDDPLTITKGTVKNLGLKCNVSASTPNNSTYTWDHGAIGSFSSTGATSGNSITETAGADSAIVVTVGTGAITVSEDPSSPSYAIAAAGTTDVNAVAIKFRASNEGVTLQKLGLQLSNTASSSASDLVKASIYDGATKIGEAFFTGSNTTATSTLTTPVVLPKDQDKVLTVKLELANVGTSQAVGFSGHLVAVDYLNAEGVGQSSGSTQRIGLDEGSTSASGVRVMKSYPTVSLDTLPSTGIADGRLMRFKVTANSAGPISIAEFNLTIATTTATVVNTNIYGYTDANYSLPISGVSTDGALNSAGQPGVSWNSSSTVLEYTVTTSAGASTTIQVPAGATRYFEVRGSVSGATSGASITTTLLGDAAYPTFTAGAVTNGQKFMADAASTTVFGTNGDFIWSPNTTTTPTLFGVDWTNGFGVTGLPSNGLINTRSN